MSAGSGDGCSTSRCDAAPTAREWIAGDAPPYEVHVLPDRWRPTPRRILSDAFTFRTRGDWEALRERLAPEVRDELVIHRACVGEDAEPGETYELARVPWPCDWEDLQKGIRARLAHDYMTGDCPHYAIALHRQHGWPIRGVVDRNPDGPHLQVMHVWAVRPDGAAVDAEGAKIEADLVDLYVSRHGGAPEDLTEAEILSWYATTTEMEGRWESPRDWEPWVPLEARWMASVLEPDADPCPTAKFDGSPAARLPGW